jgi:flagellar motor switch protein FliN/FliY
MLREGDLLMTAAPTVAGALAIQAAAAVAASLASGESLSPGDPTRDTTSFGHSGQAVLVSFAGSESGEFAVLIDTELAEALAASPLGPLDPAQALTPTVEAVAGALGTVALGRAQTVDARMALQRVFARDDAVLVPLLTDGGLPRAALVLGVDATIADEPAPANDAVRVQRLELLRGVEMEVNAELGRTRMTVNDLLGLRPGAIIELDRGAGAPADLLVNGHLIARGEVVVIDENYALRITQILSDDGNR